MSAIPGAPIADKVRPHLKAARRLGAALLFGAGPALAQLPAPVAQALDEAGIPDSQVAVLVQDLDGAAPLIAHGTERPLNPASVMKLVTTLAALDTLGPAHVFKTRVLLEGELADGVLDGNLILQGGGDPALTRERFWLLLRELRARGVRGIRGDVLLDGGHYALEPIDPGAFDQAPLRPYNAPPAALLVDHNTLNLRLAVGESGVEPRLDPDAPEGGPAIVNRLRLTDGPCNGWREQVAVLRADGALVADGPYPRACGAQSMALNLLPPEATVAAQFRAAWTGLGGSLTGGVRPGTPGPAARALFEFDSPPLAQLVRDINKFSNNVMAQMLFLNLGAARFGAPATWDKARAAVRAWLAGLGLEAPGLVLENGAGLSRIERISAAGLGRLLHRAAGLPAYYEFAASLPALGLEGTQKQRMAGTPATGRAWLKSGTLNGARNLAGYLLTPGGRRRLVVCLINHPRAAGAAKVQDALVEWALDAPDDRVEKLVVPECKH